MLNRYSTSPSLSLTVKPSRRRLQCTVAYGLVLAFAIFLVYSKGYTALSVALALGSTVLLWRSAPDPMTDAVLKWEAGEWFLRHGNKQTSVVLLPSSVRLPWLVYAAFRETHAKQRWTFLLFADSASAEQLRRLRRRLIIEP